MTRNNATFHRTTTSRIPAPPLLAWIRAGVMCLALVGILLLGGCGTSIQPEVTPPISDEKTGQLSAGTELGAVNAGEAVDAYSMSGISFPDENIFPDDPVFNTEEYAALREGGFVATQTRPLSTVSADVDTASYANLRRMLRDGWAASEIPAGAVRIEEMLNYFNYGYERPTAADDFAITMRAAACPWNDQTTLVVLGFAAKDEQPAREQGRNLVFLIDVSGSMDEPDKLDLLKDSFALLVDELKENDRISIVTYASGEELVLDGATGSDRRQILSAIRRLCADGATDGQRGLAMAYELAQKHFIEGGVNRIIMASDGDLNVGMTSDSELFDYVSSMRDTGIYLSVLGFGTGNYKDTKMELLADNGNGSYHYIDCLDEARRVFVDNLSKNLLPFADDVRLQLEFNPQVVKAWRLIGYENRAMADEDFLDDDADAAELGPGSQFTVAYELAFADSDIELELPELLYANATADVGTSDEWLSCTLRWRAVSDGQMHEISREYGPTDLREDPGDDWRLAAAVIELGMELRQSEWKGTSSIEGVQDLLASCVSDDRIDELEKLVDLVDVGYPG